MKRIDLDCWFVPTKLRNGVLTKIFGQKKFETIDSMLNALLDYDRQLAKIHSMLFDGNFNQVVILEYSKSGKCIIFDTYSSLDQIRKELGYVIDMTRM